MLAETESQRFPSYRQMNIKLTELFKQMKRHIHGSQQGE
jgi:hypothetical protein